MDRDCKQALTDLERLLERGYSPYSEAAYVEEALRGAQDLHSRCGKEVGKYAETIAAARTKRISTVDAVERLDELARTCADDEIRLKALGGCARWSFRNTRFPADRHRAYREQALALAQQRGWTDRVLIILVNWLFASCEDGDDARAAELEKRIEPLERQAVAASGSQQLNEVLARLASHRAKARYREAAAAGPRAVELIAEGNGLYEDAIRRAGAEEHLRVNLQIEWTAQLTDIARKCEAVHFSSIGEVLDRAKRALDAHTCDACRAFYSSAAGGYEELVADRTLNVDETEALRHWRAAIAHRRASAEAYRNANHHLETEQQAMAEILEGQVARIAAPKRIFLSHRGVDKPMVRRFKTLLADLGFKPWLDEDDMSSGQSLERALLGGMDESCAAVFFVTADFVDDGYLKTEIDYALRARRTKGEDTFRIIALVLPGGKVPPILETLVWVQATSELDAFHHILRALPVRVGTVVWRDPKN